MITNVMFAQNKTNTSMTKSATFALDLQDTSGTTSAINALKT